MPTRPAALAGKWYPAAPAELTAEIERCLRAAEAYTAPPAEQAAGRPVAAVAPHAGLSYSGPLAAAMYRLFQAADPKPETFVVVAPGHLIPLAEAAVWPRGEWATPLGDIPVDHELAALLIESGDATADERPHHNDNAIELQTPFIRQMFPGARIVPVAVPNRPGAGAIGAVAARLAARLGRQAVAVASTDLTHYGRVFGVMPAGRGAAALDWIRENDRRFLAAVTGLDAATALRLAEREHSACGAGAVAAVVEWAAECGCAAGRVIGHTNSHEVAGGPAEAAEHVVGYAGVIFESDA